MLKPDEIAEFHDFVDYLPVRKVERDLNYDEFLVYTTEFDSTKFEQNTLIGSMARKLLNEFLPVHAEMVVIIEILYKLV